MAGPVLLVDGGYVAVRAARARLPLRAPSGLLLGPLFAAVKMLAAAVLRLQASGVLLAVDGGAADRTARFAEYKRRRGGSGQPALAALCDAAGLTVCRADGLEADDVLAAAAARCETQRRPAVLLSGDRDLCALVGGPVRLLWLADGGVPAAALLDADGVEERFGVPPRRWVATAALAGDRSDGVAGVPGVGWSTAAQVTAVAGGPERFDLAAAAAAVGQGTADRIAANRDLWRRAVQTLTLGSPALPPARIAVPAALPPQGTVVAALRRAGLADVERLAAALGAPEPSRSR